jgi:ATP-dependent 26S proteasome regulatory subunit
MAFVSAEQVTRTKQEKKHMTPVQDANTQIDKYIRSRYPIIGIVSHEEGRVLRAINTVVQMQNARTTTGKSRKVVTWSITKGLVGMPASIIEEPTEYCNPDAVLKFISEYNDETTPTLFVLLDMHNVIKSDNIRIVRFLRDIFEQFTPRPHNLVLVSPAINVAADLEKNIVLVDYPLPDVAELDEILTTAENAIKSKGVAVNIGNREAVVEAMRGLTATEATNVLNMAIITHKSLTDEAIRTIIQEKRQAVKKTGLLEIVETSVSMGNVGGMKYLKEYVAIKRAANTAEARAAGVDAPKGVMLVGLPGTGKSLMAKAVAQDSLLIRFDIGKLFNRGIVGEASSNMRTVIKILEAVAPCYVWIDEVEKGFADNGGKSDGGEMMRALGTFLTWMQETSAPVYMITTANDVTGLRPELLRRFDDVCFADLPHAEARREILSVHLAKRNQKIAASKLDEVVNRTWGFSGAECEKVVKSAVEKGFARKTKVTPAMLEEEATRIVPVSETMKEEIEAVRRWAKGRAILADEPLEGRPSMTGEQVTASLEM